MAERVTLLRLLTVATLLCGWSNIAFAQTRDLSDVMRQVLSLPAPPPPSADPEANREPTKQRTASFFDRSNPPGDSAPIEDILEYWEWWISRAQSPALSDTVRQRLLDACLADINRLPRFIQIAPKDETTAKRIKEIYDRSLNDPSRDEYTLQEVKKWLVFNSKYFINELLTLTAKLKENEYGSVSNEDALTALAQQDWQAAEPIVQSLANSNQQRSSTLGLSLLYKHAASTEDTGTEEKYRSRLKQVASDRNAPGFARDTAIEALSLTEWSGRDDWYISLLADDSLRQLHDGSYLFNPLTTVFDRDPDKWIPVMTKLVESKDRAVQQSAASCLVLHTIGQPRRDTILPVLRWLSDPDWLDMNGTERAWFMQKMDQLEVPESVPGLIWIVENEEENRQWAARTLAHYKDPRAISALWKALSQVKLSDRQNVLEGLFESGGISDAEAIKSLEAFAAKRGSSERLDGYEWLRSDETEPIPVPVSIAMYLVSRQAVPDSLVRAVLARAESLKKTNPTTSQFLFAAVNRWQSREVNLDIIRRIASGTADPQTISTALDRRTSLRENNETDLQVLLQRGSESLGIGAVLLDNRVLSESILTSSDQRAQIGLLAAARLTQTALPVELVGNFLSSRNTLLSFASERYLLVEDSKEARKLLWQHHPDQAFITGWRENVPLMSGNNFDTLGKVEDRLRAELLKADAPVEIYALIGNTDQYNRVLRIYADRAVYTYDDKPARFIERVIPKAELTTFKEVVTSSNLEDMGPQFGKCHHDCMTMEFLALKKEGARRVFSHQGFDGWRSVINNFEQLGRGEGVKIHYNFEKEIKGLEVLFADRNLVVKDVWQRGDEIRIQVEKTSDDTQPDEADVASDDDNEASRLKRFYREIERTKARLSWHKFVGDKIDAVVAQPDSYSALDESAFPPPDNEQSRRWLEDRSVQIVNTNTIIIARNFDGLWKQVAGTQAVRISGEDGAYAEPVITPDGKWVVVAKTDTDWSRPNYIVRFNLKTGQEFRVRLEPADEFNPVAFIPTHQKILLYRSKDIDSKKSVGPDRPEYYLLDPATGETQLVSGEFDPLFNVDKRFLQPTTKPNEFWAAISDSDKNQTQVGRYDLKDFSFKPIMLIPHIAFDSMAMWVDESNEKLYLVYEGQLLRLPLKSAVEGVR